NCVRWETKQTRLFLRTREFLWQEGHCVYETEKECEKETLLILEEYQRLCREVLAIEVIMGRKSENERFAGAKETYSIDAIMPDGRALQMGTSHHLGQGFAKAFDISFLGKDGQEHTPWQNSWGVSTRLLGAMVMVHGDDKGIILPPHAAAHPVVIVPIYREEEKDNVIKAARDLEKTLGALRPILDDRDGYTPGWKFNQWELKGIPVRIELGPKDLAKKHAVLVRRDTGKKIDVPLTDIKKAVTDLLEDIHASLLKHSQQILTSHVVAVSTWKELSHALDSKKVARGSWCGKAACEEKVKDQLNGAKSINIPLVQSGKLGKCIICSEQAQYFALFGKVY
ncbi:MAG: His/Gly/Thr/Pro-type tRNA ligase C-terminal domain-containing protein, partial [Nanoarchaeota archaeon]